MLTKPRVLAAVISLLLATAAGTASAAEPFYNPEFDNGYPSDSCAATGFGGYDIQLGESIYYDIWSLADGESETFHGETLDGTVVAEATFQCFGGYVYYVDGADYGTDYGWWAE